MTFKCQAGGRRMFQGLGPCRAVHHCTPTAAPLLRYDYIGCVPKTPSRREAQRRGCRRIDPWYIWTNVTWLLWLQGRWISSSYSTWSGAASHSRRYRVQDCGWVLQAPGTALHLVLMTSHHLVLQTHPVAQGLS